MSIITPAQIRVMQAIRRTGHAPSNTTMPLLSRLSQRGLVKRAGLPGVFEKRGSWSLTQHGTEALENAEVEQACRDLGKRLSGIFN